MPFIVNIAGHCGSGKSFFISYLVRSFATSFNCICVFSNTAQFTDDYEFLKNLNQEDLKTLVKGSLEADDTIKKLMNIQKKIDKQTASEMC